MHLAESVSLIFWYRAPQGAKLRVENLHYDLTEDDLEVLAYAAPYFMQQLTTRIFVRTELTTLTRTFSLALGPSFPCHSASTELDVLQGQLW